MKPFNEFLKEKREITIHTFVSYARQYIEEHYQTYITEHFEELKAIHAKAGDRAYGVFGRQFFASLQEAFVSAGYTIEADLPGDMVDSVEHWGPPEERERCMWSTIKQGDTIVGTFVSRIFHDHTAFRIPFSPAVFGLEISGHDAVKIVLSYATTRIQGMPWQVIKESMDTRLTNYAYSVEVGLGDNLRVDPGTPQTGEGKLEYVLNTWASYGWELVNVVSHEGQLMGFFRKPAAHEMR